MRLLEFGIIFLLGFFSCAFILSFSFYGNLEMPLGFGGGEVVSPVDRIDEGDIIVRDDSVLLKIPNVSISRYADTGSMRPVLDKGTNGIRVVPGSSDEIDVGDIVTFRLEGRLIVHRVVAKGVDSEGVYFVTKGDNNEFNDGKIRFDDIKYLTIGLLY